ncbi:unnamed protein product [Mesocestoides corti]|uniref:Uncharacterized protein n=1 Tax=Mesocestoides corti TaxID=53468 RepID=A0A0R3UQK5_MESCO|nr:unnamed protein product [Mesocestoides corti]
MGSASIDDNEAGLAQVDVGPEPAETIISPEQVDPVEAQGFESQMPVSESGPNAAISLVTFSAGAAILAGL